LVEGEVTARLQQEEALERIDPGAGPQPVLVAVPLELGSQGFGQALAVRVAEAAQQTARNPDAEGVDELFPEQSLGDRVEEERALAGKPDQPSSGVHFQEFLEIEFFDAHGSPRWNGTTVPTPGHEAPSYHLNAPDLFLRLTGQALLGVMGRLYFCQARVRGGDQFLRRRPVIPGPRDARAQG